MKVGSRRPPLEPDCGLIRRLADLLAETGLSEIEYAIGDHRIRVTRGGARAPPQAPAAAPVAAAPAPQPVANGADQPGSVTAPMVGIAYLAAEPGAPPFVRVGDSVAEGQTLLIIEAMKVMNQIRSPHAGRVTRIFVEDADPVEYGAALMLIA